MASQNPKDNATRKQIFALEKELEAKNADDQDATSLKELIDKSTAITRNMERPSDQANSSAMFKKMTGAASTKACSAKDLARKLMLKFSNADGSFAWEDFGAFGAAVYSDNTAAKIDFMMGAIEPPKVKVRKPREKKKAQDPLGPELQPEVMDTNQQDDSNETSKLTEAMHSVIEEKGRQPWVFYVLDHQSFAQTVENMFSVSMLLGNAKAALVPDDEWGMCVQLPERGGGGQRSVKPEQSQMVINLNNVVWERMKRAVRPDQCLTKHRADMFRRQDEDGDENEAGPSKRARLS